MNLVQFLYALLIAYSTGRYPIKQLNSVADAKLLKAWFNEIPELKDAFVAYQNVGVSFGKTHHTSESYLFYLR